MRLFLCAFSMALVLVAADNARESMYSGSTYRTYTPGAMPDSVATADFNNDGKMDFAVADHTAKIAVFLNKGDGTFAEPEYYTHGKSFSSLVALDVDNDGRVDLVALDSELHLVATFFNTGNGVFSGPRNSSATGDKMIAADLNEDGKLDLVVWQKSGSSVGIMLGRGDGYFQAPLLLQISGAVSTVAAADLNGDGLGDLLVTSDDHGLDIFMNTGLAQFFRTGTYLAGSPYTGGITVADFDRDGRLDVAVAAGSTPGISMLKGRGDGTFTVYAKYEDIVYPMVLVAVDIDGDGAPDVVSGSRALTLYRNNGTGAFPDPSVLYDYSGSSIAVADLNGDGRPDFVVALPYLNNPYVFIVLSAPAPTAVRITSPPAVIQYGQAITLEADIVGPSNSQGVPCAALSFVDTNAVFGSAPPVAVPRNSYGIPGVITTMTLGHVGINVFLPGGRHDIWASYPGDAGFLKSTSQTVTYSVQPAPVALSLSTAPPSQLLPRALFARASGPGPLSPTGSIAFFEAGTELGSAVLNGGVASLLFATLKAGSHTITAKYAGDVNHLPAEAAPFSVSIVGQVSASGTPSGSAAIAPDSIASLYGDALSSVTATSGTDPVASLGGVTVKLRDSAGAEQSAPMFYVSTKQINFLVPPKVASGTATLIITNANATFQTDVMVQSVSPGIFSALGNGSGPAAALAITVDAAGAQTWQYSFECGDFSPRCRNVPLDLGAETDTVAVSLFATGLRLAAPGTLAVKVGGENAVVLYAGKHPSYAGLDQINFVIPRTLQGRGEVPVAVTVAGITAPEVTLRIK
jgi:uncharacterized protein (TIGR03437 family)